MSDFIKVQKINNGELDQMGLPVYDYVYLSIKNLTLETKSFYSVSEFDPVLYENDLNSLKPHKWSNGIIPAGIPVPNIQDPIYYKVRQTYMSPADKQIIMKIEKHYFICGNYRVSKQEFERVADLIGCQL